MVEALEACGVVFDFDRFREVFEVNSTKRGDAQPLRALLESIEGFTAGVSQGRNPPRPLGEGIPGAGAIPRINVALMLRVTGNRYFDDFRGRKQAKHRWAARALERVKREKFQGKKR